MTRWPFAQSLGPIGLDVGAHALHAVQLRRRRAAWWETAAAVSLPRETPGVPVSPAEISRLHGVLERRGFVGRDVVVAVPAAAALSAMLELPARAAGVPIEAIAAAEFGRVHKIDPAAVSMTMWDLPTPARASKATFAMAVGVRTDALRAHLDAIESAGLRVAAVDEPLSAVARGATHDGTRHLSHNAATAGQTAVIDFGHDAVRLAIVHGRTLAYARTLADVGVAALLRGATDAAGGDEHHAARQLWQHGLRAASAADVVDASAGNARPAGTAAGPVDTAVADVLSGHIAAVLREVAQAFGYATRQYPDAPIAVVRLAGGGAMLPGVAPAFAETLHVPAAVCGDDKTPAPLTLARGLALFGTAA